MRVLIVEDDAKISAFIQKGLKEAGFVVAHASDGEEGLQMALSTPFDAAVLDLMLPGRDGLSVLEELRRGGKNTPVIILSAKRSVDDRIKGLQAGGDDYLTKPFSFSELLARLQALIRRNSRIVETREITVGDITVDLLSRETRRANARLELQAKEFQLLEYFMRNPGRVLSKTMIMERIWGYDFDPQTNVVDVLVCRLRNKVDSISERKMIRTIRGVGYVLKDD